MSAKKTTRTRAPKPKLVDCTDSFKPKQTPDFLFKDRKFPLTANQKEIISCLNRDHTRIVIIDGPAGSAKSYTAVLSALKALKAKRIENILYLRTAVEACGKSLGFLPGELQDKFAVYRSVIDAKVEELVSEFNLSTLLASDAIDAQPINYIRGASWTDKFVIIDELQNLNEQEALLAMTRVGNNTKLIMCGDSEQSDIKDSCFHKVLDIFTNKESRAEGVHVFRLDEEDIVRDPIVKFVVEKFRKG